MPRTAEYLRICKALQDLKELATLNPLSAGWLEKAIDYLEDRRVQMSPTKKDFKIVRRRSNP